MRGESGVELLQSWTKIVTGRVYLHIILARATGYPSIVNIISNCKEILLTVILS
jgi:hypothetical protein